MNILITYRHFWPDSPPYASMLRSIATRLVEDGHRVTVLCEQPCYKPTDGEQTRAEFEELAGIQVFRLPRLPLWGRSGLVKSASKLVFPIRAYLYCIRHFKKSECFDLVWTATIPPVVSGALGAMLSRKYKAEFLYHCQDLYPEIALHMQLIKPGGLVARVMTAVEKKTRGNADVVVSLSEDMESTIKEMVASTNNIILNNFLLEDFSAITNEERPHSTADCLQLSNARTNIIFAGNIGNFQGLDIVVEAFKSLGALSKDLHLTFMGEGKALKELKTLAVDQDNISFLPHRPFSEAQVIISEADYGLVSLEPDIYKFAYPSKALTYLGLGVPLAVVVEPSSALSKTISTQDIGYHSASNTVQEVAEMFMNIAQNQDKILTHKDNAKRYYQSDCSRESILDTWSSLIDSLQSNSNKNNSPI